MRPSNHSIWLLAGSNTQVELTVTGLSSSLGVAVDTVGNVYVSDSKNSQVLKLPAGEAG